jgi:Protein of unknown function (DUF1524)
VQQVRPRGRRTGIARTGSSGSNVILGLLVLAAIAVIAAIVAHRGNDDSTPTAQASAGVSAVSADRLQAGDQLASSLLATITIKGRAAMTGYTREKFGAAWDDDNDDPLGHNGCDTRNDILARDLTAIAYKSGHCVVASGQLLDPYTSTIIRFTRGENTSSAVQIDHVVALGDAWQTGAQQWSATKRLDLGNDPLNLLAVDGPSNQGKGDADAASWLPPNSHYRCAYVARQVAVKAKYGLWMTAAEHTEIAKILSSCPGQTAPTE